VTFTEDWFDEKAQVTLAELARSVADVPGIILEIGAWEGRSTVALANAVAPRVVHTVDTWAGSPSDSSGRLAAERDVLATWKANVAALTAGHIVAHRMDWRDYVATIAEPVALCFIDAEHTYREVFDNIVAVLPLLSPGGILCGDDIEAPAVHSAVCDAIGGFASSGVMWWWKA